MDNHPEILDDHNEIDKYDVNVHAIQNQIDERWRFVLGIYPYEDIGNKKKLMQPQLIKSRIDFATFEYALESGMEALAQLGFIFAAPQDNQWAKLLTLDVFEWDLNDRDYVKKVYQYDGDQFKRINHV